MRKNGVDARFRFDRRVGVQLIINFVALYRNREKVRIGNCVERIGRLFRAHPAAHGGVVIPICQGKDHQQRVNQSLYKSTHHKVAASIVAYFSGSSGRDSLWRRRPAGGFPPRSRPANPPARCRRHKIRRAIKKRPAILYRGALWPSSERVDEWVALIGYSARNRVVPLRFTRSSTLSPALWIASWNWATFFTG
jgi:hypothetical protein